ncbi:MAG: hypothetical protein AB1758_32935, partial [Candidatus Eremiobacterota bacterium]
VESAPGGSSPMHVTTRSYQGTRGRPAWAPDGSKFAAEVRTSILVFSPDGETVLGKIGPPGWNANPAFSPDGSKIAFANGYFGPDKPNGWSLQVADADGSNVEVINKNLGWRPEWSADGRKIAYTGYSETEKRGYYTWVTTADGSKEWCITPPDRVLETEHRWDPTGQEVVTSGYGRDGRHLMVMDETGRKARQITFGGRGVSDQTPEWSPEGNQIVFEQHWEGGGRLSLVDPYGDEVRPLVDLGLTEYEPTFSPDGQWVAFSAGRYSGTFDIHVVKADGSETHRLTTREGDEYLPSWSPDGKKIAFLTFDRDMNNGVGVVDFDPKAWEKVTPE